MDTTPTNSITAVVHRGAQFLDIAVPDWFAPNCATPIDVQSLDLGRFSHCILGQLCTADLVRSMDKYGAWCRAIQRRFHQTADLSPGSFQRWTQDHGFYPIRYMETPVWKTIAKSAWIAEITHRRKQAAQA